MLLCAKCHKNQPTIHHVEQVDGVEKANVHLCLECAGPLLARQEAILHAPYPCEFCGGSAYTPIPGAQDLVYACCRCCHDYARIFFELCAAQRPDLLERSQEDIFFFDRCFDFDVEAWSVVASQEAIQKLKRERNDNSRKRC
jgi:hypothetical protein